MFLLLTFCVMARLPSVQTFLVHKISDYLSKELNTTVRIGSVRVELVKKVVLNNVYVQDQHHDTLIFAPRLKVEISAFNRQEKKINFSSIELQRARVKLQRYAQDDGLNLQFIIDYFSLPEKDTSQITPWGLSADNLKLTDVVFSLKDHRYNDYTPTIDFDNLFVDSLNAAFSNIRMEGDTLFTFIRNISLKEKSSFALNHFEADAKIAPDKMQFKKLDILTPNSSIKTDLVFSYNELNDFNHFLTKVQFVSDFRKSKVSSRDIAFFTSELIDFDRAIDLSGNVRGTVSQLKGKDLDIHFGEQTFFKGKINLTGLPDIKETFIDLVVDELVTVGKDIESIPVSPFKDQNTLKLPAEAGMLGTVRFKGKFTGFYNDFVAYGNLNSALGFVSSDINLKLDKAPFYSGHITTHNFELGKLWSIEKVLGKLTMNAEIKGTHFNLEKISATVKGNIGSIELYKYNYHNITLDAKVAKKLFNGSLAVDEDNLHFSFEGTVDYTGKLPLFDFKANISDAKLAKLNLIKRDTSSTLTVSTQFHIIGNNIDNMDGFISLKTLRYSEKKKLITADEVVLESVANGNDRHINLSSDFADFGIRGDYRRSSVLKSLESLVRKYLPGIEEKMITVNEVQDFNYSVKLKNMEPILDIFIPSLKINPHTSLSGNFNTLVNDFRLLLVSDKIRYGNLEWKNITLTGKTNVSKFDIGLHVNEFNLGDSLSLRNMNLGAESRKDSAFFNFTFEGKDSSYDHVNLGGDIDFNKNGNTIIHLLPSEIVVERRKWNIDNNNMIKIDSSGTQVNNLTMLSGNQHMSFQGEIASGDDDVLKVNLVAFETKVLNRLLDLFGVNIRGVADGNITIAAITNIPKISSNLKISNFSFFNDTLGTAHFNVDYNSAAKTIYVAADASKGEIKNITIDGKYYIKPPQDEMDFSIVLAKTSLQPFGHYISGFASDVRGVISGDFTLKGLASKPVLKGNAKVQKASFLVDYLNTRYSFSDNVTIAEDGFYFNNITVNDDNGNKATVNGRIYHRYFKDFGINMSISANRFLCLDTDKIQNELYYGKAYASGVVNITGSFENLYIIGTLTSAKGTRIYIPLSNPEEVGESSFITFISSDTTDIKIEAEPIDLSGLNLDFEFEATPDAEIILVFDEKIGDVMKGRGSGTVRMVIDQFGTFNMYGEYVVYSGDYLFTLQNVINKRFDVERGGTIKWNGSPLEATIDLNAKYKVRAVLYDLLQDTTATFRKRTDVILNLSLKNRLMNPDVSFRIEIPNIDPATESLVKRYINSDQEINRQTLSLLVLNRFSPPYGEENRFSGTFEATASELLSNQLSNWAQQLTTAVDIGIAYRAGDQISSEELEVILSTKLFNDRVTVDGVVGVTGANETTQTTSSIVGDFNVDVQVSDDGRFHFKAFNRSNNNTFLNYFNSLYTQGIGVFYRQEFDKAGDLFKKKKDATKDKKPDVSINSAQ